MNKLSVATLPLSITLVILAYNLGFIAPVSAQEDSLFSAKTSDIYSQFYLTKNQLDFSSFQYQGMSLESILLLSKSTSIYFGDRLDKITNIAFISQSIQQNLDYSDRYSPNHSSVDLEQFRVKSESVLVPNNLNTFSVSSTQKTRFIDNPINQTLAQIEQYNQQNLTLEPFTKVSNLRDIKTTDWAYDALLKLIDRYRCFAGFDDNSFKGHRTLTRYEFASALNICLQKIATITTDNLPPEEDLAKLKKLQAEFEQELLTVQSQTNQVEERITFLEDHNFSTTTILRGEVVFQLANVFGNKKAVSSGETPTEDLDSVVTFGARTRLNLETSFTGKDLLRTRIEAGNLSGYGLGVTGTQMTFLGVSTNTDNNVRLGQLFYRFPLGDKGNAYIAGARQSASAFIPLLNRATTISLFGFNNPLYDLGFGAGGGAYYQFSDLIGAGATYYSGSPNSPEPSKGLFNGDYSALAQVTLTPSEDFGISFSYARFFTPKPRLTTNLTGFTGSLFAQLPFGLETATSSNNFNISLSYQVSDRLEFGGWVGYINAVAKSSPAESGLNGSQGAKADIWTAALTASYNDLGKLGSKLSFILGLPPKLTDNDVSDREDKNTALHLEFSYNYPLTEQISLTPGVLAITNPEHNDENDTIVVGLLRTTFQF